MDHAVRGSNNMCLAPCIPDMVLSYMTYHQVASQEIPQAYALLKCPYSSMPVVSISTQNVLPNQRLCAGERETIRCQHHLVQERSPESAGAWARAERVCFWSLRFQDSLCYCHSWSVHWWNNQSYVCFMLIPYNCLTFGPLIHQSIYIIYSRSRI